jgi:enoyl-CoA hydratase/carnithine racemase
MQTLQPDYFAAYRSLKLMRDANGVLVVEFHSNGGPFTFTAQDHTEFVDAFYRIAQDRANKIVILTGAGGEFIPGGRFFNVRKRRRSRRLEPSSRRGRSDSGEHGQHTRAGNRGD